MPTVGELGNIKEYQLKKLRVPKADREGNLEWVSPFKKDYKILEYKDHVLPKNSSILVQINEKAVHGLTIYGIAESAITCFDYFTKTVTPNTVLGYQSLRKTFSSFNQTDFIAFLQNETNIEVMKALKEIVSDSLKECGNSETEFLWSKNQEKRIMTDANQKFLGTK